MEIRELCHKVGYEHESYESACDRIVKDIESLVYTEVAEPII
jgi:hypothetical protein